MHIKKLVLDNFKSFGRRTEIPFYEDFTTVSGPNGSGKSNIIDSVLFALGLARTRGIRAEKLTDLIYNPGHVDGEAETSGPREASVEVVLDNGDGTLDRPFRPTGTVDKRASRASGSHTLALSPAVNVLRWQGNAVPGLRATGVVDTAPLADPARPGVVANVTATEGAS